MNTHLSPQEFVDVMDGTLADARVDHLEHCEACRHEVGELRGLMHEVGSAIDLPEPSPLFWDHFSRRVHAATEAESVPTRWWAQAWRPLVALAAMAAVATVTVVMRTSRPTVESAVETAQIAPADRIADVLGGEYDESFEFVTGLAANLSFEELQEVAQPTRDVTAAAVDQLSPAQRAELARLIKAEMGGLE